MARKTSQAAPEAAPLTSRQRWLFGVLMALVPVLFFVLLEGVLRLVGYGADYPLFVPVPGVEEYRYQSREVARRYFVHQENPPTSLQDAFLAEKDSSVFRVMVQGGSSAAGYPYYYGGSFSRMLEQRLQQSYPNRTVEVVNTAMAAVNSYTLRDFADEIIAERPDAVLIYAGHNEYYGALGVGSTESLGRFRGLVNVYLRLQHLRLMQGLRAMLRGAAGVLGGAAPDGPPGQTLMERMVGEQTIPYRSALYQQGLDQFRGNLRALLAAYRAAGIPVFIGTVASNERDQRPFVNTLRDGLDAAAWTAGYRQAVQHIAAAVRTDTSGVAGPTDALASRLDVLIQADTLGAADAYYARARLLDTRGHYAAARADYQAAKDRDGLRFRAPEAINAIIRAEADRAEATVVEAQAALAARARDGLIGHDLMLEHLHPNVEGYFTIADAFYEAVYQAQLVADEARFVPAGVARREVLLTAVDSLQGTYRVEKLMGSWPFQPPGVVVNVMDTVQARTPIEAIALDFYHERLGWREATEALRTHHLTVGDDHLALRASLALIQQFPFLPRPYAEAADILVRQRRWEEALAYFGVANDIEPTAQVHFMMATIHLVRNDVSPALRHLNQAIGLDPRHVPSLYQLARAQLVIGNASEARTTLERLLIVAPDYEDARRLLGTLPPAG